MAAASYKHLRAAPKSRSLFDLPPDFFDSCRRLLSPAISFKPFDPITNDNIDFEHKATAPEFNSKDVEERGKGVAPRWTCNTCKSEFESLQDQRSHFRSDVHRLNVKLSVAGKKTINEEDFDELDSDSLLFQDFDVSIISGSEDDEFEKVGSIQGAKQKLYLHLNSGDSVSVWRSLILDEYEDFGFENNHMGDSACSSYVEEGELISRLKLLVREPRDRTRLRIMLLASGGHFAGCVFDGNSVVAHKTFHRYVVRAKAGKKQSSKDGTGKAAHSAGSSLRRHNEAALKKDIQELLVTWKPYIDSSSCIFVYAPAKNRQILFDGENPQFGSHSHVIRHIPLTVHRPTLKEAKRIYNLMTHMAYEAEGKSSLEEVSPSCAGDEGNINQQSIEAQSGENLVIKESSPGPSSDEECLPSQGEIIGISSYENETTRLHEAARSGDAQQTLELLEQGLDPCIKDARGRTPYMLATEKEVRNTFRRYMASNLDQWDWHAANVPSPLTKEMEDSQAEKQAEKDAKRKAKAKELKKSRKAKEKAKAQAVKSQNVSSVTPQGQGAIPVSTPIQQQGIVISKEEEQKRALAAEREKRAAAAERRIAALNASPATTPVAPSSSESKGGPSDVLCSCCNASLTGKVPFHRYHYKYCSTTCMHVHREMLEDS